MTSNTPFICARCLRAARIPSLSRPNYHALTALKARSRSYGSQRVLSSHTTTSYQRERSFPSSKGPNPIRSLTTAAQPTATNTNTPAPPPARQPTDLSQSAPPARTTALLNPRRDPETGEQWHVDITARAARRLQQIMASDNNPALCLRVAVESGGCHGFQYMMALADCADVAPAEDTVFVVLEGGAPGTAAAEKGGADWMEIAKGKPKVVLDEPSLELLQGSKIDYTMELIGSQFKIVDNPRATSSCGCGTSFDVKI